MGSIRLFSFILDQAGPPLPFIYFNSTSIPTQLSLASTLGLNPSLLTASTPHDLFYTSIHWNNYPLPTHLGSHIPASLAVSSRLAVAVHPYIHIHPNKTFLILSNPILSQCRAPTPQIPPRRKSTTSVAPKDPPTTTAHRGTQALVHPAQAIEPR